MSFVTPLLLAGTLFVAVPIVLHLVMRREPKQLQFPALRFVVSRRAANQTRMRLRQWLLLALRCALIALLALALARPTLRGSGKLGGQNTPIAAALVFDNSLRMDYMHKNHSRLDEARRLGNWLLNQLPVETPIAILSSGDRQRGFVIDRGAAALKVSKLISKAATRPLSEVLSEAISLLAEKQEEHRGEVYVFTDLSQSAWNERALGAIAKEMESSPNLSIYVIDVGVEAPQNLGISKLQLSDEALVSGNRLEIDATLIQAGDALEATEKAGLLVELFVNRINEKGTMTSEPEKRGQQIVTLEGETTPIRFSLSGLDVGAHQGLVRIAGSDPLSHDNSRYFTVLVQPPRNLLLIADKAKQSAFVREALTPSGGQASATQYEIDTLNYESLGSVAFRDYHAVFLLDPIPLKLQIWDVLIEYVRSGNGLGIFLGRSAKHATFNEPAAEELLGASLRWQSREETFLRPVSYDHPIFSSLKDYAASVPWANFPVFKFWALDNLAEDACVIASFANAKPAILTKSMDTGRVLTMTTPISDEASGKPWNILPTGPDPWPFIALTGGIADYLSGGGANRLNYEAGQTAVVNIDAVLENANYVLRLPSGESLRQSLILGSNQAMISSTSQLGNYRILAGGSQPSLDSGFSVNAAKGISNLGRVEFNTIQTVLGKNRVQLARSSDEIEIRVGLGRMGRELFPWLICFVAMALGGEHLLANRFYRRE